MKKISILLAASLLITFSSCSKDEDPPAPIANNNSGSNNCNCGLITSDDASDYSVTIKNDCSGNYKTFILSYSNWLNAHPGERLCITNTGSWKN